MYESINGEAKLALNGISLAIPNHTISSIVGSSGSGKTTLLRIIAKLESITSGEIEFKYDSNGLGFVFQDHSVFPWMTVAQNIGYALKILGFNQRDITEKVKSLASMVGLPFSYLSKYPKELSGGERRRLAIASALSKKTQLLLLDEPTSQLDDINKWAIQDLVQRIWSIEHMAVIWVTHDIEEAVYMAEQVIIMKEGQILETIPVQIAYPRTNEIRATSEFLALKLKISELLC